MIMIIDNFSINLLVVMVCAALISFTMTPIVRVLAHRVGAIDVPKDDRRMHKVPIPRMGGLAIFAGFVITTLVFCEISDTLLAIWFGGLVIVTLGILDDIFRLNGMKCAISTIAENRSDGAGAFFIGKQFYCLKFFKDRDFPPLNFFYQRAAHIS